MDYSNFRALVIGAHPDDCEFLTGGTAVMLAKRGVAVTYVSLTNGETGHFEKSRAETAACRRAEMEASCKIAGVGCRVFDIPSNGIEADIPTRERVIRLIREARPNIIFAHRTNDYHPDHRRAATLVMDSSYAIRVPAVCPETPCLRYSPIILYMYDAFTKPVAFCPDVVVDTDGVMRTKVEMLNCHASQQYEWLPWIDGISVPEGGNERFEWLYAKQLKTDAAIADKYRQLLIKKYGAAGANTRCAEAFEVSEYSRRPSEDELSDIFSF